MLEMLVGPITGLLDKFIPDADEKARLAHEISTMATRHAHELAKEQISINREEARHTSIFVSGWRPATGWVCVSGMAFNFICVPIGNFACALAGIDVIMPNLDIGEMMPVLLGMLGLGAMRTVEKTKKVARD
jgi:phenylpyruvate tautomerase PptA (4-oxalocrotonate tautomerase family)